MSQGNGAIRVAFRSRTDSNRVLSGRAFIIPVRSGRICRLTGFHGEIVNRVALIYFVFQGFRQAYGDGRSIIVAAYGDGGFTRRAEEFDIVVFAFAEVDGFRVRSVSDTEFCGNIGDCRGSVIDVGNDVAGDVFG